jgi:hypothetical protein
MVGSRLCAVSGQRLSIIDIHDPDSPIVVSKLNLPFFATDIAGSASHAYVTAGERGLWIVDCTQPSSPHIAGSIDTPYSAGEVAVTNHLACVADGEALITIDVSNPASPQRLASATQVGGVFAVDITETHAFVAGQGGFNIVDIANPQSPVVISNEFTGQVCRGLVVSADRAYLAGDGFSTMSIGNLEHPAIIGRIGSQPSYGLAKHGDRILLVGHELTVLNVANPRSPWPTASIELARFTYLGTIAVSGSMACIASSGGMMVVDIGTVAPRLISRVSSPDEITAIAIDHGYAFTACRESGLGVFEVETSSPRLVGHLDLPGRARTVCTQNDLTYLTLETHGLWIVDVSNPAAPNLIGSVATPTIYDCAVAGGYAYVTSGGGILTVDVSNPSTPRVENRTTLPYAAAIDIDGDKCYVTSADGVISILVLAPPGKPTLLGQITVPERSEYIEAANGFAYALGSSGTYIIDVSDPSSPTMHGFAEDWRPGGIAVDGDAFYVTNSSYLHVMPLPCDPDERQ